MKIALPMYLAVINEVTLEFCLEQNLAMAFFSTLSPVPKVSIHKVTK